MTIYLDTSVVSAYFDERTPDRRDETQRFWDFAREYQFVISRLVANELQDTPDVLRRGQMLELVKDIPLLPLNS